jgi:hypothetical protein
MPVHYCLVPSTVLTTQRRSNGFHEYRNLITSSGTDLEHHVVIGTDIAGHGMTTFGIGQAEADSVLDPALSRRLIQP